MVNVAIRSHHVHTSPYDQRRVFVLRWVIAQYNVLTFGEHFLHHQLHWRQGQPLLRDEGYWMGWPPSGVKVMERLRLRVHECRMTVREWRQWMDWEVEAGVLILWR